MAVPVPVGGAPFWMVPGALLLGIGLYALWRARRRREQGRTPPLAAGIGLVAGLPLIALAAAAAMASWDAPQLRGLNVRGGLTLIPEFVALTVALATYTAAFIAEIVRAGILSVSEGQREAAQALGLRPGNMLPLWYRGLPCRSKDYPS